MAAETWQPGPLKKAQELSCAQLLLSLARPRGTMLLFRNAASGVFDLRARLHAVLYERNGHRVHPSDLEPGGVPLAREICDQGMAVPWVERVDSQVDITDSVGEELSVDAARALGLVLGVDVQQLAQQDAELMEHVVEELCDHSLGGDGFDSGPVLVHTPLHAISCVKLEPQDPVVVAARAIEPAIDAKPAESGDGGDGDDAAASTPAKYFRDDLVKFWTEHGDSLSPVLPVLPAALARPAIEPGGDRRRVRQLMLAALAGIERGMPLVAAVADADSEDDAELEAGAGAGKSKADGSGAGAGAGAGEGEAAHKGGVYSGKEAGDWTMAKAAALAKGAESAEEDERAFYRTMRGTWGSFTGTGQGQIVELASQQADDGYNFGGGPVAVTTAPGAPKGIAPGSPVADGDKAGEGGDAKKTKKPGSVVPPQMKIASLELAQQAIGAVRDPWYPHGTKGGFFNAGLLNWHATRSAWLIRPLTQEPDAPPLSDDDIDEIVEELAKLQRTYTLPRPMRLGDIIDLYCEIWDAV